MAKKVTLRIDEGSTLWDLARILGTSVDELKKYNNLNSDLIRAGDTISWLTNDVEGVKNRLQQTRNTKQRIAQDKINKAFEQKQQENAARNREFVESQNKNYGDLTENQIRDYQNFKKMGLGESIQDFKAYKEKEHRDAQSTKDLTQKAGYGIVGTIPILANPAGLAYITKNIPGFIWNTTKSMISNPLKTVGTMSGSSIANNILEPYIENKYIRAAVSGGIGGGLGATIGNRATQGMARFLIGNIQNNKLGLPSIVQALGSQNAKDAYVKAADTFLNKTQLGRALVTSDALAITPTVLNPTTISGKIGNQIIRYNPHFFQNAITLGTLNPIMSKADEIVEEIAPGVTGTLPYEFIKTGLINKAGKTAGTITSQKIKLPSKGQSNLVEVGESLGKPSPPFTGTRLMDTNKGKLNHEPINTNKTTVMDNTYTDNTNIKRGYALEEGGISDPTVTAQGYFIVGQELPKINPDKISLTELGRLISASRDSKHTQGVQLRSSQTNWGLQNLENSGLTARDLADSEVTYVDKGKTSKSTNMKLVDNDGRLNTRGQRGSDNHDNDFISQDLGNGKYAVVNAAGHLVQQLNLPKGKTYQYKDSDGTIKSTNKIQIATDDPGYSRTQSKYNGAGAKIMGLLGFSGGQFLDMNSNMRNTVAIQPLRTTSTQKLVQKVPEIPKGNWGILYPMMVAKTAKGYPELQQKGMNVSKKGISKANYNKLPNSARQYFKLINQNGKNKYLYNPDNNAPNYSTPRWVWEGFKNLF